MKSTTWTAVCSTLRIWLNNRQGCADALKAYYQTATKPTEPTIPTEPTTPTEPEAPVTIEKKYAYAGRAKVTVNGKAVDFQTYTIDDYTYLSCSDVAGAVNGQQSSFRPTGMKASRRLSCSVVCRIPPL